MHIRIRQTCRICGSKQLVSVLDLGPQFLSTHTLTDDNQSHIPKRKVPLELVRCNPMLDENACGLVQLKHTYPSELMFTEYWYRSGINKTMQDALADIALSATRFVTLKDRDIVVDIGCNDGTLLNAYQKKKFDKIGFDPALNFSKGKRESFERIVDFFSAATYFSRRKKKAKVVTSIAMFYDLEAPGTVVADIAAVLDPSGVWILQFADLASMLTRTMFDNMIHEHLEFYHLAPVEFLLKRHGLKLVDIERNHVNGGSYRLYIRQAEGPGASPDALERIMAVRREEFDLALDTDAPYVEFRNRTERIKRELVAFVREANAKGQQVIAYGASTKGNTILQYCGLTEKDIPFVADRNPLKWGGRTVGSNMTIISEEDARKMKPDYFLVLPYYFLEEMREREREYLRGGGKFVIPVPELRIIED